MKFIPLCLAAIPVLAIGKHVALAADKVLYVFRFLSSARFERDRRCSHPVRRSMSSTGALGFEKRVRGGHHIFRKNGVAAKVNLRRDGAQAKPYQVKQVRALILAAKPGDE